MPTDAAVVQTAAAAAEDVIFSRYATADVTDFDVTVHFEDDILEVDVYLNADDAIEDPDVVARDAALAARAAVDELFENAKD